MSSDNLIVITCASGKQNSFLIPKLINLPNTTLRLIVHSSSSHSRLSSEYPSAEVIQADLSEPSAIGTFIQNATVFYHVGPPFAPHETEIGYHAIDAAVAESARPGNRFRHFVFSSVLNTQLRKLLNHDCKRYVEEYLMESGLNYTILQPTHFMDNMPVALMREKGIYPAPYDPEIKFSFLALRDLGEVAAKVIQEGEKHYLAQYPLCSTGPVSYTERVAIYDRMTGKQTKIVRQSYEDAVTAFAERMMGEKKGQKQLDVLQRLLLYYDNHGLRGSPTVCEWLLGRKPTSLEEWYRIQMEKDGSEK